MLSSNPAVKSYNQVGRVADCHLCLRSRVATTRISASLLRRCGCPPVFLDEGGAHSRPKVALHDQFRDVNLRFRLKVYTFAVRIVNVLSVGLIVFCNSFVRGLRPLYGEKH